MSSIIQERFAAARWAAQCLGIQEYEQDILAAANSSLNVTDGQSWGILQGKRCILADLHSIEKGAGGVLIHAHKVSLYTAIPTLILYGCCYFSNRLIPIVKFGAALVVLSAIVTVIAHSFFQFVHGRFVALQAQQDVHLGRIRYTIETLDDTYNMPVDTLNPAAPDFAAKRQQRAEIILNLAKGIVFLRKHVQEHPESATSRYLKQDLTALPNSAKAALRKAGPFFKSLLDQQQQS